MRPTYGCPENFRVSLTTPTALFPTFSWAFVPINPMNVPTKFEVRSFTRSWDNRGYPKNWAVPGYSLFSTILMGFYSDRPYTHQIWSPYPMFTRSRDNRGTQKFGQSLDMPTLHFLLNFEWAFTWIGPVNVPAKFEVRSFTCSWDKRGS